MGGAFVPWHDMLLLIEGQPVQLPAPKTHYTRDIVFDKDTPVFATGQHSLVYVRSGQVDERGTEMMSVRRRIFNFFYQIPSTDQKVIPPCPTFFAGVIFENAGENLDSLKITKHIIFDQFISNYRCIYRVYE